MYKLEMNKQCVEFENIYGMIKTVQVVRNSNRKQQKN